MIHRIPYRIRHPGELEGLSVVSCMYFNLTYVAYAIIHDTYSFYFHDFRDFHRNIL